MTCATLPLWDHLNEQAPSTILVSFEALELYSCRAERTTQISHSLHPVFPYLHFFSALHNFIIIIISHSQKHPTRSKPLSHHLQQLTHPYTTMSIFTSPSPETVGLTCMVTVLLAILLLIILGSIWDYIRRRRARDWDLTSFSEQEKDDGVVTELGRDWESERGDALRETTAHEWDLERRGTSGGGGGGGGGGGTKSLSRADGVVGSDCLGRAVPYAAVDGALQRHERQTKHDHIGASTPIPERISSLPPPRPQQQRQYQLSTPPPAQHSPPRSGSAAPASPKPVQKLLPQLPVPTSEEQHRYQHSIFSSTATQFPQTPPHPRSSERNPKPLPLTPWVCSFLPSTPSTSHAQEPELTWSSSPPTSSTLPSSSPPVRRALQPQPRKQQERPSSKIPRSLDLSPGGGDGSVKGHTRLRDPSDSSPTYYFLPLLSPAHPPLELEDGSGLDGRLQGRDGGDVEEGEVQYDDESPTLPPVIDTPTRKTKRRSTIASRAAVTSQPRTTSSPAPLPNPLTHANNPLPPLPLRLPTPPLNDTTTTFPPSTPSTSTALSTHLAASRTWGRGAGRSDGNGKYNVPRKPLAVRKDTAY